jgi:hypothetical protein
MDGNSGTEGEAVAAQLEETQLLRVFYDGSSANAHTNTLQALRARRTHRSPSSPRLSETRYTRSAA